MPDSRVFDILLLTSSGWINDENPLEKAQKIAETNKFQTPLDEIDAAARIVDPIISGILDLGLILTASHAVLQL